MKKFIFAFLLVCFVTACKEETSQNSQTSSETSAAPAVSTPIDVSAWMGKWHGPEGTYLDISEREIGYTITIANLDGPREFNGIENDGVIEFERDNRTEIIRPGDGAATGMKWLVEKNQCLVVTYGEGYCRD
jgi:hypothetical protein